MSIDAAPEAALDLELARVMHAALGKLLKLGPAKDRDRLLSTPEEAAERLRLKSTNWLYKRSADRSIPATYIAGALMFSERDLEQIVEMHGQGGRPRDTARARKAGAS
jgi:hypothetical protein